MGNKDAGNLGMQESVSPAQNEMYADFIVKYMGDFQEDLGDVPGFSFKKINGIYGVVYAPLTEIGTLNINTYSYSFIPKCYTHMEDVYKRQILVLGKGVTHIHESDT